MFFSLPRLLFRLTCLVATLLLGVVLLSPLADDGASDRQGWRRLPALFARDGAVRRTGVASALGLYVTAWVFFRPPAGADAARRKPPPSDGVVGA